MNKYIIGHFRKCDLLTMLGTTIAFIGMILAINEHFSLAVLCLLICGICDGFDGTLARKYKYSLSQSVYGAELDSLSDVICFGVFPAILTMQFATSKIALVIAIFYMLCGVIRLAYFNMLSITKEGKKGVFIGFPITFVTITYPIVFFLMRLISFDVVKIVMPILLLIQGFMFIVKIEIPKPNVPEIFKKCLNKYTINFIIFPLFLIIMSDLFFKIGNFNANPFYDTVMAILHHIVPFMFIFLVFCLLSLIVISLFNDSKKAKICLLTLIAIVLFVNDIKFTIMGKPLVVTDVNFLNPDNIAMIGTSMKTIGLWIFKVIGKTLVLILLGLFFIWVDKYHNFKFKSKKMRFISLIISIILFALIICPFKSKNNFYLNNIYSITAEEISEFQNVMDIYYQFGFFEGLYLDVINGTKTEPDGYSLAFVENLLSSQDQVKEETKAIKWDKANVVFILSESFFDFDNITEITFDKNLTSNIDNYQNEKNALVMDLLVPVYGGVSVNTEYEILTGSPLSFSKAGYIPYNEYYTSLFAGKAPNIIKEFNNNGYETIYLTPWGEDSYQSKYVYSLFEAKKTIYNISNGNNKGYYYSDDSLMDDIYNELKDTNSNNLKFIFSTTAQNHYPYEIDKYDEYDIKIKKTSLSKEASSWALSYAQGVYDADQALNKLYEKIQSLKVPTIIVFFGDHLPYLLDEDGNHFLENSNYIIDDYTFTKLFTTKAVILSNYDITHDDIDIISSNYLGSYIINHLNLDISNYFKFIENTRKTVPAFNRNYYFDLSTKEFIDKSIASDKVNEALQNYRFVEYRYFFDR